MKGRPAPRVPQGRPGQRARWAFPARNLAVRSISITGPDGAPSVQDVGRRAAGAFGLRSSRRSHPAPAGPAGKGTAALAYQLGSLRNEAADGALTLSTLLAEPAEDYALSQNALTLREAGTYLLRYTVFVPEQAAIDTVLRLQANEQTLLSSVVHAMKSAGAGQSATFGGQALLVAGADTLVRLTSSAAVNIADTAANCLGYALGGSASPDAKACGGGTFPRRAMKKRPVRFVPRAASRFFTLPFPSFPCPSPC